ncbi:MAG: GH3 auxin-responsive promoter family protein [Verrucomicrobia subdivision 3 bacterium]|nr:GH3 auxin-responsive promoter family protein [Limisphaerales bacterium]
MNLAAAIANSLWVASNVPAILRFEYALTSPTETQSGLLRRYLKQNAPCAYGRAHDFARIRSYEEFARRVPLISYDDIEPWIERIKRGERRVLTTDAVTHLVPTSGSTGSRKLIPFTGGLQQEFGCAIGPWLADLTRSHPTVLLGPAYWSITPAIEPAETQSCGIPIGFSDDVRYLSAAKAWLARRVVIAPNRFAPATDVEEFRYRTLVCLLKERDLRLISVWHPSFLTLLLEALPRYWNRLLAEICKTQNRRASELKQSDPERPSTIWPRLQVVSCWGDGAAALAIGDLRRYFPGALVQPKGLMATEAFVTIPFRGLLPLAVRSHFFEFIAEDGRVRLAHDLRKGEKYEVVVTTAGGLWRYRLRDSVQATGFVGSTPSLRFLGRIGNVSDVCGEKLSEAFATRAVQEALGTCAARPRFALLAPDKDEAGWRYTLYVEGPMPAIAETLDACLRQNPQYAYCRELGQLLPVRMFAIDKHGYEIFVSRHLAQGMRLGDIKPACFSRLIGWSEFFSGKYIQDKSVLCSSVGTSQ